MKGAAGRIFDGWNLIGIGQMRSGNPLTVFLANNRSQSQWNPSSGPGLGFDRPSLAPGYTYESAIIGRPENYFDPNAFVLQPSGTLGNIGRNGFIGPNLRTFDLAAVKNTRWSKLGENTVIQFRVESFNLFNRANFGTPGLQVFAGSPFRNASPLPSSFNQEPPAAAGQSANAAASLSSFGLVRSTVTSARQIQFGLRVSF
jgi:hypothetical protein